MAEGDIGSVQGTLEFESVLADEAVIIHVSGNVYAIAYKGVDTDGWIKAVTISSDGATIALAGGSLEFDAVDATDPDIIHISGDVYAIAYSGVDADGWIKTVTISSDGATIALAGGSLEFETTQGLFPCIKKVFGDVYAIACQGESNDGWIKTVTISSDGATIALAGGSLEFDDATGSKPEIVHVINDVYAIAYTGPSGGGWIKTVTISSDGATIALAGGSLEFDTVKGGWVNIISVTGDVYAIVYVGDGDDGWIKTVTISSDGATVALTGESLEYDTTQGKYATVVHVSGNVYAIAYTGPFDDGWIKTITISAAGAIGWADETGLEFDAVSGLQPFIVFASGNIYAIVYGDTGGNGSLKTVDIETIAAAGVKHLMLVGVG